MWASSGGETQAGGGGGNFLGRISIRRNQVASMEADFEDLEVFQKKISERFSDLLLPKDNDKSTGDSMMSIEWLRRLVDAFLCCEAEFKAVLLMGRDASHFGKSPLDKMIPELLERTVKALDVCNAITHGVEAIRHAQKLAEVAVLALEHRPFTDGQIRRARKSLASLLTSVVVDEKGGKSTERSWSFGRRDGVSTAAKDRHLSNFRSLSWSVSKNWSAAKQIQAISNNLYPPRGGESTGLAMTVYIMSVVLSFVMWTLVAATPCQERTGLVTHIPVPKQPGWAQTMCGLQEKIAEEWKKKEKKGSAGLMEEIVRAEKLSQSLMDLLANFQFPMESEREAEIAAQVAELAEICRRMEEGLGPLQQQIREVFHRIVRSRTEVLDMLDQAAKASGQNV
ncbi:ROH1A-like protein [Drosera capensis]